MACSDPQLPPEVRERIEELDLELLEGTFEVDIISLLPYLYTLPGYILWIRQLTAGCSDE